MQPFELEPPDEETSRIVEGMLSTPALAPAHENYVRFYSRSKKSDEKSRAEGRPIFEALEYVEILTAGDKDSVIDRPVRSVDKYLWTKKYVAFRQGKSQDTGLPLTDWGGVSPERAAELAPFRVKTVEQLSEIPDSGLQAMGVTTRAEREKARGYLAVMKGNAPIAEMKAENEALKARMEALEKTLLERAAQEPPKRGPGRPPKEE